MEGRVQVISREFIKPSSATPNHLKKLKLSYLDQRVPAVYVPLIFFYQAEEKTKSNHAQISQQLKQSLSNTLTSFYPLAGRVEANFIVDCNDAGVEFIDARIHAHLMDVIQEPNMEELKQYLPIDPTAVSLGEGPLFLIQVTIFDCGGIAIGVCFSHQIADFTSAIAFFSAWAATCRGEAEEIPRFRFDAASYFPSRDLSDSSRRFSGFFVSTEKLVPKRFVFDKVKIALLRQADTSQSESTVKDPSPVQLVSAFIWKNFIQMIKSKNPQAKKVFGAFHVLNLRKKNRVLENVFGNCVTSTLALSDDPQCEEGVGDLHDLVNKLRSAMRRIGDDYITKAQNGYSYMRDLNNKLAPLLMKGELELFYFTSWCGFPVYEVDYGWGKPIWFCSTAWPLKNLTILVDSKSGDGVEAMVMMAQDDLEKFENQIKLDSIIAKDQDYCV